VGDDGRKEEIIMSEERPKKNTLKKNRTKIRGGRREKNRGGGKIESSLGFKYPDGLGFSGGGEKKNIESGS